MKTEIAAMQELCHQHICKLYQVIETEDRFYMILEVSLATLCGIGCNVMYALEPR